MGVDWAHSPPQQYADKLSSRETPEESAPEGHPTPLLRSADRRSLLNFMLPGTASLTRSIHLYIPLSTVSRKPCCFEAVCSGHRRMRKYPPSYCMDKAGRTIRSTWPFFTSKGGGWSRKSPGSYWPKPTCRQERSSNPRRVLSMDSPPVCSHE